MDLHREARPSDGAEAVRMGRLEDADPAPERSRLLPVRMPDLRPCAPWEQDRPGVPEDRDGGDIRRLPVGPCAHEEVRRTAARSATRLRREIARDNCRRRATAVRAVDDGPLR